MISVRLTILLMTITIWSLCDGYRILGVFPFRGRSHFVMFEQLMKGLARRGHQVDIVSTFPLKTPYPNYTDVINLNVDMDSIVNNMTLKYIKENLSRPLAEVVAVVAGNNLCESLGDPKIQKFIDNPPTDPPYDLFITEVMAAHCFMIIGHRLNVPIVGVSTTSLYPWLPPIVANPDDTAIVSNNILNYVGRMNFWERLYNTIYTAYCKIRFNSLTSKQDEIIRKYFGADAPGVRELEYSVALILTNTHYSLNGISPMTPAVVEVGGLHIQDDGSKLAPELKKWMDESKDGFVYFSFGSMMKIESFPEKIVRAFYKSMEKIAPVRVLMKIAKPEELLPGLPKNVMTYPWLPQYHVLKHHNVKAFITHGGLMGTQEAIHFGVPMIGMPLFADQFINIKLCVNKKIAVMLHYKDVTEKTMDKALNTILKDPAYRESARALSAKFLDRPLSALDTACYWVEYIIQHGKNALRSPAMDISWWELALLDIFAVLLLAVVAIIYLLKVLIKIPSKVFSEKKKNVIHVKKVT